MRHDKNEQKTIGFVTSLARFAQLKRISLEREMSMSEVVRQTLNKSLGPVSENDKVKSLDYVKETYV